MKQNPFSFLQDEKPKWKTVRLVMNSGRCLMDDGSFASKISNVDIHIGEKVLVYNKAILKIHVEDSKPVYIPSRDYPLIICYLGTNTGDYSNKKYYELQGTILREVTYPSRWNLTDDGAYGVLWDGIEPFDPWTHVSAVYGNGARIPHVNNGIASISQLGNTVRYILNQSLEDEVFRTFEVAVHPTLETMFRLYAHPESLIGSLYSHFNVKPFILRYLPTGFLRMGLTWQNIVYVLQYRVEWESVINPDLAFSPNFDDVTPTMSIMEKVDFQRNITPIPLRVLDTDYSSVIAVKQGDDPLNQEIVRVHTYFKTGGTLMNFPSTEPGYRENYLIANNTFDSVKEEYNRCSCEEPCYCLCSVFPHRLYYMGTSGTIPNDVKLIFALNNTGLETYVRIQKDTAETQFNWGVYIAGVLIEESGWENSEPLERMGGYLTTVNATKTRYRIIHAHHSEGFDAAIYRKTTLQEIIHADLPYCTGGVVHKIIGIYKFTEKVEYLVVVNGMITKLPAEYICREFILNRNIEVNGNLTQVNWLIDVPWQEIGFDRELSSDYDPYIDMEGQEDNKSLLRIFTTASTKKLLLSFDIFPIKVRHKLETIAESGNLLLGSKFDDTLYNGFSTMPPSDFQYEMPIDRKWWLFDTGGQHIELNLPFTYNRVNGICILEA